MRKTGILSATSIVLIALIIGITGCKSSDTGSSMTPTKLSTLTSITTTATTSSDDSAVRAYADAETETTLQGLNENNRAKYIQYGNPDFQAAVTQQVFDSVVAQINGKYGAYISKEFQSTDFQQGYTVVYYKTKYAKADITIKMVFDSNHQIAGHFIVP
jgi:Protein of unknown function (DUF3887)